MNENTKNLIECVETDISGKWIRVDNAQKLIELTVKECIDILANSVAMQVDKNKLSNYNEGWVNGRLLGIDHIKDHFGLYNER